MPFLKSVKMSLSSYSLSAGQTVLIKYASNNYITKVLRHLADDGPCNFFCFTNCLFNILLVTTTILLVNDTTIMVNLIL